MASKEATIYIVDVGASMAQKHNGRDKTDLDWALEYVWDRITATVATDRKTAHIGVIGLKTDDTSNEMDDHEDYENITVFQGLKQTLMPDLRELGQQLQVSNTDSGDAISAIVIAVQMITTHCRKLQYTRRIILITNGLTPMDASDVSDISEKIKEDGMELLVLGIDFDDADYGYKEEDKPDVKAENEAALKSLAEDSNGTYGTLAQAIDELHIPRVKTVRPIASYKGFLTLGDPEKYDSAMAIDVERYPKTMVARPPTASNFVIRSDLAPGETQHADETTQDGLAAVKRNRTYQVPDESAEGGKKDVDEEDLAKGYAYGSTAVYISESDRNVTTYETKQGLDIIGFVAKEQYEPYLDMSRANVIVAQRTNDKAVLALSSFIRALYELDSYAVARFVAKPDKAPVILLLRPSITPDLECLYDVELPFAEDLRQYRFSPLDRILTVSGKTITQHRNLPTQALQDAMSAYVDAMDLSTLSSDGTEYAPIDETFSPVLHRVNQAIRHRAVHPSSPVPPIPQTLTAFSNPPPELTAAAADQITALSAVADIKRVPPKTLARRKKDGPKPLSGLDVNALLAKPAPSGGGGRGKTLDPLNAVPEFRQRLQTADSLAAVHQAMDDMGAVVRGLVTKSTGDGAYGRALEGMRVMRAEMVELEDAEAWNKFLKAFKRDLFGGELGGERGDMWFEIRAAKVGLIRAGECEGGVGDDEAKEFLAARR